MGSTVNVGAEWGAWVLKDLFTFILLAVQPNFFNQNLVMMGKTYYHLNMKEHAKSCFQRACLENPRSPDEKDACVKAKEMIKKLESKHTGHRFGVFWFTSTVLYMFIMWWIKHAFCDIVTDIYFFFISYLFIF